MNSDEDLILGLDHREVGKAINRMYDDERMKRQESGTESVFLEVGEEGVMRHIDVSAKKHPELWENMMMRFREKVDFGPLGGLSLGKPRVFTIT